MSWLSRRGGRPEQTRTDGQALAPVVMQPIGTVRSKLRTLSGRVDPGQRAAIELAPELAEALDGLAGFSHAIVLTWLDRVSEAERGTRRERPSGDRRLPAIGVLALRTHHRPNPIGLTVVTVDRVDGAMVHVTGLDAIDGTPVLDIKPYIALYDSVPEARLPDWAVSGPPPGDRG